MSNLETKAVEEANQRIELLKGYVDKWYKRAIEHLTEKQALEAKIEAANKKLAEFNPVFTCENQKKWVEEMGAFLIPRKEELTCDKTKEPPCHLEPSAELCQKCPINKEEAKTT